MAATKFSFFDISTSDRCDFPRIIEIALFIILYTNNCFIWVWKIIPKLQLFWKRMHHNANKFHALKTRTLIMLVLYNWYIDNNINFDLYSESFSSDWIIRYRTCGVQQSGFVRWTFPRTCEQFSDGKHWWHRLKSFPSEENLNLPYEFVYLTQDIQ